MSDTSTKEPPSLDRLIKLMKMTTVAEDNMALVAIRKANEEVARFNGDWEAILRGKIKVIEDPFKNLGEPPKAREAHVSRPAPPPPPQAPAPRRSPPPPGWPNRFRVPPGPRPQPTPTPPPPPPKPILSCTEAKRVGLPNKFPGHCFECGGYVSPMAGFITAAPAGGWKVFHDVGNCKKAGAGGASSLNNLI